MLALLLVPVVIQGLAMLVDEGYFHRRRGLPRWERIGHPLDTLTVAACYLWLLATSPDQPHALPGYVALAAFSCLFVTKDEPVHARVCSPGEQWLHALLFLLHPVVFIAAWMIRARGLGDWALALQLGLLLAFASYQFLYWRSSWSPHRSRSTW